MDISSSSYNWSKDSDITSKSPFLGFKQNLDIICAQYYGMQRPMWEGKKKRKETRGKRSTHPDGCISFSKGFPSWCHRAEGMRKYLMSFYPLCLCTLCIRQPVTIELALPAFGILLQGKGSLLLSGAKIALKISWK